MPLVEILYVGVLLSYEVQYDHVGFTIKSIMSQLSRAMVGIWYNIGSDFSFVFFILLVDCRPSELWGEDGIIVDLFDIGTSLKPTFM